MFWNLLLAHFLADYPLQTARMAAQKNRLPVLVLHTGIHFAVLLLVITPAWRELWPYCLMLAVIHFFIDYGKSILSRVRPNWVALPYLVDQALHYLVIAIIAGWINRAWGSIALALDPAAAILATGYLLATYVWAISEKVLTTSQPEYRQELAVGLWPRMAARALLLTGLLWLFYPGLPGKFWAFQGAALPYFSGHYARRALFTDLLVGAGAWLFIVAAYWLSAGSL